MEVLLNESTKWIFGFENRYAINKNGDVISFLKKQEHILVPKLAGPLRKYGSGYKQVCLTNPGNKNKYCYIHKLVLETFIGPCPPGKEVRHKDGNHLNNKLDNLIYGTRKENMIDRIILGTQKGSKNSASKLTEKDVLEIKSMFLSKNDTEIAKIFNVCRSSIGYIRRGKTWRHV